MKGNSHLLIKGQNPGVQEDFPEDIATQGIGSHEFDVELRENTIATSRQYSKYKAFIPQTLFLISRPDTR